MSFRPGAVGGGQEHAGPERGSQPLSAALDSVLPTWPGLGAAMRFTDLEAAAQGDRLTHRQVAQLFTGRIGAWDPELTPESRE